MGSDVLFVYTVEKPQITSDREVDLKPKDVARERLITQEENTYEN